MVELLPHAINLLNQTRVNWVYHGGHIVRNKTAKLLQGIYSMRKLLAFPLRPMLLGLYGIKVKARMHRTLQLLCVIDIE